jgi:poly-gamma-glutamate synthesis protein (capsule biosynthesis protein)
MTLFLCGDVMTGRGIDQVLPQPCPPELYEPYVDNARVYVELAERASGAFAKPVDFSYVWGDALDELQRRAPDAAIVNLETAVTKSSRPWPGKGIHYRMSPANVGVLTAFGLDCCALANNHVLDWGTDGLAETLGTLRRAGLATAGAGANREQAQRPAALEIGEDVRILVFSFAVTSSGVPSVWRAAPEGAGIWLLDDLSDEAVDEVAAVVSGYRRAGDVVLTSIHWGSNWGYEIPQRHRRFARRLIDRAAVAVVHGHSSHHPLGIEVHRGRPVLYGCGDFLNDYEGIGGREEYRANLSLGYWLEIDPTTGQLLALTMTPFRIRRFRLERASAEEATWLATTLSREGRALGTEVWLGADGALTLSWSNQPAA